MEMQKIIFFFLKCSIFYCQIETSPLRGYNIVPAALDEFPFIVSISLKDIANKIEKAEDKHLCGGTLITRRHVLTAAHCLRKTKKQDIVIIVNTIDLRFGKRYDISSWTMYNDWIEIYGADDDKDHDIAVIKLKECVSKCIVLPEISDLKNKDYIGQEVKTAGWGVLDSGETPTFLLTTTFRVLSHVKCRNTLIRFGNSIENSIIPERLICTQAVPSAVMSGGDSGGPLIANNTIIGVNESNCPIKPKDKCKLKVVNFHVGIEYYRNFIDEMTIEYGKDTCCRIC